MDNSQKKLVIIAAVLALLAAGGVYWFYISPRGDAEMYNKSFSEGRDLLRTGDTRAITRFEEALDNAPTKDAEALAELNLGTAYLLSDSARGIAILKEVANNESYAPFYRAGAINYVVQHAISKGDVEFSREHVFSGDIWSSFYDESEGKPNYVHELAARRAFEWSASLFSTFPAEYWLATWYAGWGSINPSKEIRTDYFRIAKEHIAKGDAALELAAKSGRTPVSQLGIGNSLRATALAYLYAVGEFAKQEEIEATYRAAIAYLEQDPNDFHARGEALFARFYLAGGVVADGMRREGTISTARATTARGLLEPIYKYTSAGLFAFLKIRAGDEIYTFENDTGKYLATLLARVDPKFKALLLNLGWKEAMLK